MPSWARYLRLLRPVFPNRLVNHHLPPGSLGKIEERLKVVQRPQAGLQSKHPPWCPACSRRRLGAWPGMQSRCAKASGWLTCPTGLNQWPGRLENKALKPNLSCLPWISQIQTPEAAGGWEGGGGSGLGSPCSGLP